MAEMLDDTTDRKPRRTSIYRRAETGGWSVEASGAGFSLWRPRVPTIVASAAPLLNLAHALRHTNEQPDIDQLRRTTMEAIGRYERDLASARISPERARAAHYVVCATVDDVVLSKPWGVRAGWARSGLVSTFHMDVTGGDRVFDLLDHFHQSPGTNKDLLLLIYLCLSLAFEGRTRVSPRGTLELGRIRDSLYKTLLGQYGVFERELSPHWRGVSARHKPLRTAVALWTLLSALVAVLCAWLSVLHVFAESGIRRHLRTAGQPAAARNAQRVRATAQRSLPLRTASRRLKTKTRSHRRSQESRAASKTCSPSCSPRWNEAGDAFGRQRTASRPYQQFRPLRRRQRRSQSGVSRPSRAYRRRSRGREVPRRRRRLYRQCSDPHHAVPVQLAPVGSARQCGRRNPRLPIPGRRRSSPRDVRTAIRWQATIRRRAAKRTGALKSSC